jgi:hypothetical protein
LVSLRRVREPNPRTGERKKNTHTVAQSLKSTEEECERLRAENIRLRAMLGIQDSVSKSANRTAILVADGSDANIAGSSAAEKKIALFRSLFRGREDVYAVRWEGTNGKSGYSPAGAMDWRAIHAARPEDRKTVDRNTRMLQPLTDKIHNHFIGRLTIEIYPLLPD